MAPSILISTYLSLIIQSIQIISPYNCPSSIYLAPCVCQEYKAGGLSVVCEKINNVKTLKTIFRYLTSHHLHSLILENSNLPNLPSGIFANTSLEQLTIRHSKIASLHPEGECETSPFVTLEHTLKKIKFENVEGIADWSWSSLEKLRALEFLDLSTNRIQTIKSSLRHASTVKFFKATHTRIHVVQDGAFTSMNNIYSINLAHNKLRTLSRKDFPRPASLLKNIYLSGNFLEYLPDDLFEEMPVLETIDLSNNALQIIPTIKSATLFNLHLHGNPILCDCSAIWLALFLKDKSKLQGSLTCAKPKKLRGLHLETLTELELCKMNE